MSAYQLIWFRQDLRIQDHAALWHAQQAGPCIALVILSPEQSCLHDDAPIKLDFYLRQLVELKQQLNALNIPLLIETVNRYENIPAFIHQLMQQLEISQVFANMELPVNEQQRDQQVAAYLQQNGQRFTLLQDRTLFPVASIRNKTQQPYQVFTAFKNACYERLQHSLPGCFPAPHLQQQNWPDLSAFNQQIPELEACFGYTVTAKQQALWPVGEQHALSVLDDFVEQRVKQYKEQRDFPSITGTSQLSGYLTIGILSVRQCIQALFREQQGQFILDNPGQQTWLNELLWREFYQHILFDFPQVSKHRAFKVATEQVQWRDDPEGLQRWQQGQTGIPIVDAGMRQLLATGWVHNRVRMIVAMFLTKNLLIDWRLGEQWFMRHLIDGELAANNGGWQWCASTGTDAAPYFRVFNPISQSEKFDANGDYIRHWVPELAHLSAEQIHEPYGKNPMLRLNYPRPMVDLKSSRARAIEAFKNL